MDKRFAVETYYVVQKQDKELKQFREHPSSVSPSYRGWGALFTIAGAWHMHAGWSDRQNEQQRLIRTPFSQGFKMGHKTVLI